MANVHKLTFNEPQGRNAGLLWTRAVWATAEHKGGEKAASSLSDNVSLRTSVNFS